MRGDSSEGEYARHRTAVLGLLAKRFPRLDADERLAIYHDAWARVLVKRERGEKIESLRAYLLATAGAEALHVVSRGKIPTPVGPDDPRLAGLSDDGPPLDEQVVTRDQARIARSLLDTLDERQRDVLKLRWDLQLSGSEVRAALGLSMRQYRRLAEEGATALAERVEELENGQWSRRTRSLLVACLVEVTQDGQRRIGIASRRQREEAQRLLDSDPHVAALYAEVRRSARGATALLPLPVLAIDSVGSPLARAAEFAADVRDQLFSALETTKQHATSLYIRAADPTLLTSGPRPGTAVVAVAGALAVGGGAYGAYDAVSAAPEPRPAAATTPRAFPTPTSKPPTNPRSSPSKVSTRPAPKIPTPSQPPVPSPPPQVQPTPTPPQPTNPTQPTEFGFED
ncbi:MAG TPA: sigma-70 family RNA polymerase sigma factor [Thermoleophilaceae bacterium]|nr:sigma-70 family RNA polymerase sigma factor [Thermoleophilaceae bacterium]